MSKVKICKRSCKRSRKRSHKRRHKDGSTQEFNEYMKMLPRDILDDIFLRQTGVQIRHPNAELIIKDRIKRRVVEFLTNILTTRIRQQFTLDQANQFINEFRDDITNVVDIIYDRSIDLNDDVQILYILREHIPLPTNL